MPSRLMRALRKMTTEPSAMSWWRPLGSDAMLELRSPGSPIDETPVRDGSSADLRDRQRDLAFDMYAEALVRLAEEDDAAHRSGRRATA